MFVISYTGTLEFFPRKSKRLVKMENALLSSCVRVKLDGCGKLARKPGR
jgi:hypothetical protein